MKLVILFSISPLLSWQAVKKERKFLVLYLSGIGTAKMLSTRLQQEFPEVQEIENSSFLELDTNELGMYDLIVSTVLIKGMANRYVQVSPILTDNEIRQIEKEM